MLATADLVRPGNVAARSRCHVKAYTWTAGHRSQPELLLIHWALA